MISAAGAFVALCYLLAFVYLPRARRVMLWIAFPVIMLLVRFPAARVWAIVAIVAAASIALGIYTS